MRSDHLTFFVHRLSVVACLVAQVGCCMCANPYDEWYPAYGGARQRADMISGRVGSAFQDAEGMPYGEAQMGIASEPMMDPTYESADPYLFDETTPTDEINSNDSFAPEYFDEPFEGEMSQPFAAEPLTPEAIPTPQQLAPDAADLAFPEDTLQPSPADSLAPPPLE